MWPGFSGLRVYLATGATDLRKSIDSLSILVSSKMGQDPSSGHLFAFCNRRRDRVKVLYWDRDGFCLWQKRLSRGTIRWPRDEAEVRKIGYGDLSLLLSGMDLPMGMEEDMPAENSAWW